jgi:hypothetical protein
MSFNCQILERHLLEYLDSESRAPYALVALEVCQTRIRSDEVQCTLCISMLKPHQGRRGGVTHRYQFLEQHKLATLFSSFRRVSQKREQRSSAHESKHWPDYLEQ